MYNIRFGGETGDINRELFKISCVPHYVLIGRDGKILNDNFRYHSLADALAEYEIILK